MTEVDLDYLQQMTLNCLQIYKAVGRAKTLTAESQQIADRAKNLLHQTGIAFLENEPVPSTFAAPSSRDGLVSAYVEIEHAYADLLDSLSQLAKSCIGSGNNQVARKILQGLATLEPPYPGSYASLKENCLSEADELFSVGAFKEGRALLLSASTEFPKEKAYRLAYLSSFVEEASYGFEFFDVLEEDFNKDTMFYFNSKVVAGKTYYGVWGGKFYEREDMLLDLQKEWFKVSRLTSFQNALQCVQALKPIMGFQVGFYQAMQFRQVQMTNRQESDYNALKLQYEPLRDRVKAVLTQLGMDLTTLFHEEYGK